MLLMRIDGGASCWWRVILLIRRWLCAMLLMRIDAVVRHVGGVSYC